VYVHHIVVGQLRFQVLREGRMLVRIDQDCVLINFVFFFSITQGLQTFLSKDHISYYPTVRGPYILRNVIVSGYVAFYQFTNFS